jgi:hypothetical protein
MKPSSRDLKHARATLAWAEYSLRCYQASVEKWRKVVIAVETGQALRDALDSYSESSSNPNNGTAP